MWKVKNRSLLIILARYGAPLSSVSAREPISTPDEFFRKLPPFKLIAWRPSTAILCMPLTSDATSD